MSHTVSERFDRDNLAARLKVASFFFEISNVVLDRCGRNAAITS
jgi:hypothetical protein